MEQYLLTLSDFQSYNFKALLTAVQTRFYSYNSYNSLLLLM